MGILKFLLNLLLITIPIGVVIRIPLASNVYTYPIDVTVVSIFLVFLFLSIKNKKTPKPRKVFLPLFFFYLFTMLSLSLNARFLNLSFFLISFLYLGRFIVYSSLLFTFQILDKKFIDSYKLKLAISGFIFVIFGYVQYALYPNLRNLYYAGWDEHLYRMFSTFLDPNFAGAFLVLLLLFLLGLLQSKHLQSRRNNIVGIGGTILTIVAIFLTYSRSTFVMFIVSLISYFVLTRQKRFIFFAIFILVLGIALLPKNLRSEGVHLLRTASIKARIDSYRGAITIFRDSPIYGVGFNSYRYAQKRYGFLDDSTWQATHAGAGVSNSFLFLLATTGVIGFFLYFNFWYQALKQLLATRTKGQNLYFISTIVSSVIGIFTHSLFENTLFYSFIMVWYFLLLGIGLNPFKESR